MTIIFILQILQKHVHLLEVLCIKLMQYPLFGEIDFPWY
jgi:hypothetical protein